MAGYSQTPLAKKLGIKEGFVIRTINAPEYYRALFSDLPGGLQFIDAAACTKNLIHFFTTSKAELQTLLPQFKSEIQQNGIIWVSWPKKTSRVPSEVTEQDVRDYALAIGLVDIKVCAVDDTWSALKLVIPVKDRK